MGLTAISFIIFVSDLHHLQSFVSSSIGSTVGIELSFFLSFWLVILAETMRIVEHEFCNFFWRLLVILRTTSYKHNLPQHKLMQVISLHLKYQVEAQNLEILMLYCLKGETLMDSVFLLLNFRWVDVNVSSLSYAIAFLIRYGH